LSALLQRGRRDGLLYATGALLNYGGVNWFRTLIVVSGQYLLVIDRVMVVQPGLQKAHVEWNCLGRAKSQKNGFRLAQKGVFMDVTSASGWRAEQGVADQSACWKGVLSGKEYPYASFPLTKLVFHIPAVKAGQAYCLGTLLAATRSATRPDYTIAQEPGSITIEGPHKGLNGLRVVDRDLVICVKGKKCEVRFAAVPETSKKLNDWAKHRDHNFNPY